MYVIIVVDLRRYDWIVAMYRSRDRFCCWCRDVAAAGILLLSFSFLYRGIKIELQSPGFDPGSRTFVI